MTFSLKVDPRKAHKFVDYGLPDFVLKKLNFASPLPIQAKMLALNASGISSYVTSVPRQGKTTAAVLGMLATPQPSTSSVTNLILVPTPALADQYVESLGRLGGDSEQHKWLYRTGSVESDEDQHARLVKGLRAGSVTSLVATPQRLLDYLSTDASLLPISFLRQIVVDEFDVFGSPKPLETLLVHLLKQPALKNAILTFLGSRIPDQHFTLLPQVLSQLQRPMYEVKEPEPEWGGKIIQHSDKIIFTTNDVAGYAKCARQVWAGAGLVIPPSELSAPQLQEQLHDLDGAVVVHSSEVAGLDIVNLENIYVLNAQRHASDDISRLKWMLSGETKNLHIVN